MPLESWRAGPPRPKQPRHRARSAIGRPTFVPSVFGASWAWAWRFAVPQPPHFGCHHYCWHLVLTYRAARNAEQMQMGRHGCKYFAFDAGPCQHLVARRTHAPWMAQRQKQRPPPMCRLRTDGISSLSVGAGNAEIECREEGTAIWVLGWGFIEEDVQWFDLATMHGIVGQSRQGMVASISKAVAYASRLDVSIGGRPPSSSIRVLFHRHFRFAHQFSACYATLRVASYYVAGCIDLHAFQGASPQTVKRRRYGTTTIGSRGA